MFRQSGIIEQESYVRRDIIGELIRLGMFHDVLGIAGIHGVPVKIGCHQLVPQIFHIRIAVPRAVIFAIQGRLNHVGPAEDKAFTPGKGGKYVFSGCGNDRQRIHQCSRIRLIAVIAPF